MQCMKWKQMMTMIDDIDEFDLNLWPCDSNVDVNFVMPLDAHWYSYDKYCSASIAHLHYHHYSIITMIHTTIVTTV